MPALNLAPARSFIAALSDTPPARPFRTWWRHAGQTLRPPRPRSYHPRTTPAQDAVLHAGLAGPHQVATILHEPRRGPQPTLVLGGFVPDATEQVLLLRPHLLHQGTLYSLNYPRHGFSPALLVAQFEDLVQDITRRHGQPPVVLAVSFGCALVINALRHARATGRPLPLAGQIFVSPVIAAADIVTPGAAKPATLLGRALAPFLLGDGNPTPGAVEKARSLFLRMFEAGAQNKNALLALMTPARLQSLHHNVVASIRHLSLAGACERVRALRDNAPLGPADAALSPAPTLVLFAEKEDAVLDPAAPCRDLLGPALTHHFPAGRAALVHHRPGPPVQHASLIFHAANFLPPLRLFYRELKTGKTLHAE